jgi:hypothetical protein
MIKRLTRWWQDKAPKWLKTAWSYIGLDDLIAVIFLVVGILGFVPGPIPHIPGWSDFYHGIKSELVGLGITVLILGNADQYIRTQMEKRRLILQMGSPNNEIAIEAVRQLRSRGWLTDGTTRGAYLKNAKLSGADLEGADLSRVKFRGADLSGANLMGADLSGASLLFANLSEADLRLAKLGWAYLMKANLCGANLVYADLSEAYLMDADLRRAYFMGANLSGADLEGAYLSGANLRGADLSGANLIGLDLSVALLQGAYLSGSQYNDQTIIYGSIEYEPTKWPDGFDPAAAGAIITDK